MKIIIAPAKKMKVDLDTFEVQSQPIFKNEATQLIQELKKKQLGELQDLWKCSDKLTQINYQQLQEMNLDYQQTPAIMAYVGIQYQYMAPDLMTIEELQYLQNNLRILSGLYGILMPFDGIVPYRLEMQSKLVVNDQRDLYKFWGDKIYQELFKDDDVVLNLASKEYAKSVSSFIDHKQKMITVVFGEEIDGKVKQKATAAKMARGEMVNFLAKNRIYSLKEVKKFNRLNYNYSSKYSNGDEVVFIKR